METVQKDVSVTKRNGQIIRRLLNVFHAKASKLLLILYQVKYPQGDSIQKNKKLHQN